MDKFFVICTVEKDIGQVIECLKPFREMDLKVDHIETRPSRTQPDACFDVFVECAGPAGDVLVRQLVKRLQPLTSSVGTHLVPWYPKTISDLDLSCRDTVMYGAAELTEDHPGYGDVDYMERRKEIAQLAFTYKEGNPIPRVEYTKEELKTWAIVFKHQTSLYPTHACKEFNEQFPKMFAECGYSENSIPQLEDVSNYLKACTGFELRPVAGWISSRDFLAALAFRVFPCTQYIRHSSSPKYTPEPDLCHELMGHAPLLADPRFAQFTQDIGQVSLGLSDEWVEKLSTLYWFTVEFGMCWEGKSAKACGAGLLSSCEELEVCVSETSVYRDFNCSQAVSQKYPLTGLQPFYYVAKSFDDMQTQLREFTSRIPGFHNKCHRHIMCNEN